MQRTGGRRDSQNRDDGWQNIPREVFAMRATYTRLFTDASGVSRFEDIDIELVPGFAVPPAEPLNTADFMLTERCSWVGGRPDWKGDAMHPTPRRLLFVIVKGEVQVQAGSGEIRRFSSGSVALAEDTTGTGHASRITGPDGFLALVFHPQNP
jgi:hypothetical protein